MKHLRYFLMAALVAMPLTACDEDSDPVLTPEYGTVTGTVGVEGIGLANVSVSLVGATSQSAVTGLGGTYTFTNVEVGSYGVSMDAGVHLDVVFATTAKATTISEDGEVATVDFVGSYIRTGTITGTVTAEGAPLAGVEVTVEGGPDMITNEQTTNAGGEYFASGLRAGTFTVSMVAPDGVTFPDVSHDVTIATGETKTAHFIGDVIQMATITGAVTVDNVGTAGVAVALSNTGGAVAETESGPGGAFNFMNVTPGTYTVTITAPEDTEFDVLAKDVTVDEGDAGVVNFAGRGPQEPATISIQSITQNALPIDLTDVAGQIEVTLNINRGDRDLDHINVLIGGEVVATQTFAIPVSPAEAVDGNQTITLNVPTTQVRLVGDFYVPVVFNGGTVVSADLYEVGVSGRNRSNEVPVVMNNIDALFLVNPTLTPDTDDPSVVVGSNIWYTGDATFVGAQYLAYSTVIPTAVTWPDVGSAACAVSGSLAGSADAGLLITNNYDCTGDEGTVIPNAVGAPLFSPAIPDPGPDGSTVTYPDMGFSRIGADFMLDNDQRWLVIPPVFPATNPLMVYMDNLGPTVYVDGEVGQPAVGEKVAFRDEFDQPWINADYTFVQFSVAGTNLLSSGDVWAFDGGVGLDDPLTQAMDYNWAGTPFDLTDDVCTDVVKVTGDDYDESQASDGTPDGWRICGMATDLLGNSSKSGPSNFFGVDKEVPTIRAYDEDGAGTAEISPVLLDIDGGVFTDQVGPLSLGTYDANYRWAFEALDGRSGFDQGFYYDGSGLNPDQNPFNDMNGDGEFTFPDELNVFPAYQSLTHYPGVAMAPLTCGTFDNTLTPIAGDQFTRTVVAEFTCVPGGLAEPGNFAYINMVTDRAGNMATLGDAIYAVDEVDAGPTWSLFQFVNGFYTPGQPAGFEMYGTDDLEVIEAEISLTHPTDAGDLIINYGFGQIDAFERLDGFDVFDVDPWNLFDATKFSSSVVGQIHQTPLPVFGRFDLTCGFGGYASCLEADGVTSDSTEYNVIGTNTDAEMLPTAATAALRDVGYNVTPFGANINFIPAQWSGSVQAPWSNLAPGTAEVIIRRFYIAEVTPGTDYTGTMEAPTSIEVPFFDNVALVNNDLGEVTICGFMTYDGRTDNGTDRFFNYSGSVVTGSVCDGAAGTWHVVGFKDAAALVSAGII